MTGKAFRIVEDRILNWIRVWVVTGGAAEARIIRIMAAAGKQPVGLKTQTNYPTQLPVGHHLLRAAMTRAAEFLRHLIRSHIAGIKDALVFKPLGLHRTGVLSAWSMTGLASDTRNQTIELQLQATDRARGVTGETIARLVGTHADWSGSPWSNPDP